MLVRISAFVIWALVAATAVFWGLRLFVRAPSAPPFAVAVDDSAAVRGDLTRLLGAAPAPSALPTAAAPETSARFKLLGIMAPKPNTAPGQGVALIAVDGKPARAFVVGSRLDDDLVLQAVSLRTASIGPARGQSALTLEMPPLAAAATGTLPAYGGSPVFVPSPSFVPAYSPPATPAPLIVPPSAQPPRFVPQLQPSQQQPVQLPGGEGPPPRANLGISAQ